MRVVSASLATTAIGNDRQVSTDTGKFAGRIPRIDGDRLSFGDLARFAFPKKTAASLAHFCKCDVRTCERWLEDKHDPDADALGVVMLEIMRRFHMRAE